MEKVRNWKGKTVGWSDGESRVGWVVRTFALAALLLVAFCVWALPGEFANEHRTVIWSLVGAFGVATAMVMLKNSYGYFGQYPELKTLNRRLRGEGGFLMVFFDYTIPVGGRNPESFWIFLGYGLFATLAAGSYGVIQLIAWHARQPPTPPTPPAPPSAIDIWFNAHWLHIVGVVAVMIALYVLYLTVRRHFTKPFVVAMKKVETEHKVAIDDLLAKNRSWEEAYKELEGKLAAAVQAAQNNRAALEQWGELVAQAALLLRRVAQKRGDGDIGEARIILEHVLEALLITDEIRRQAALYRAREKLNAPERKRFEPPKPPAPVATA